MKCIAWICVLGLASSAAVAQQAAVSSPAIAGTPSAVRNPSPAARTVIPNGYLRLQTGSAVKNLTRTKHTEDVRQFITMIQQRQPNQKFAGAALVDRETGQIVALISATELALPAQKQQVQ